MENERLQSSGEKKSSQPLAEPYAEYPSPSQAKEKKGLTERLVEFAKEKTLRIKKRFDILQSQEYIELVWFDFRDELADNPPLDGKFSADEELQKIKKMKGVEKRVMLESFKDKLVRQRIAFARCRIFVEHAIEYDVSLEENELQKIVDMFAEAYGFTDEHTEKIKHMVREFKICRNRALEARELYPDDIALANFLTDANLSSETEIEVTVGPMSIDMKVDQKILNKMLGEKTSDEIILNEEEAAVTTGFSGQTKGDAPVFYTVTGGYTQRYLKDWEKETERHEREHIKNKIFRKFFEREVGIDNAVEFAMHSEYYKSDIEIKLPLFEAFAEETKERQLERVKDEILARIIGEGKEGLDDLDDLFFKKNAKYGFLRDKIAWKLKECKEKEEDYADIIDKVMEKYKQIIKKGVEALFTLIDKGKYPPAEAVAFFTDKPISEWSRLVARLLSVRS